MGAVKDINGNVYTFRMTPSTIKRCLDIAGVSPLDIFNKDSDLASRLITEPNVLADILYACCKPELDAKNITAEQFGDSLNGDCMDAGWEALKDEVVGFSPTSRRQVLETIRKQQDKMQTAAADIAMEQLNDPTLMDRVRAKMRQEMQNALQSYGLMPATNAPE